MLDNNNKPWFLSEKFRQHWNDYTYRHDVIISLEILKNRTYLPRPSLGHIRTRCALIDNFEFATYKAFESSMSASECQCCLIGQQLEQLLGNLVCIILFAWCRRVVMRWWLKLHLFFHHWRRISRRTQQCTVCRCTACLLCGRCLSQFRICVCVFGLVRLLSVSKFSLRQSASLRQ